MQEYRQSITGPSSTYAPLSQTYVKPDGTRDASDVPKYCPTDVMASYPPQYDSLQHGQDSVFSGDGYFQVGSAYPYPDPQRVKRVPGKCVSCPSSCNC